MSRVRTPSLQLSQRIAEIQRDDLATRPDVGRLARLVHIASEILDTAELRTPDSQSSLEPFRAATRRLTLILIEIATLSSTPSIEVGDALGRISCKALKRADRCRHDPRAESKLPRTAHGFFFVLGEFGRALNYSQRNRRLRGSARPPIDPVSRLLVAIERSLTAPSEPMFSANDLGQWRVAADWLIRDAADLAVFRRAFELAELRRHFGSATDLIRLAAESKVESIDDEFARITSTLEAIQVLLIACTEYFPYPPE
ncbi:MAG: hypothetical protein HY874_03585 [Chloroflexi bacterium]|nr:hypothetical protein [Chloroflexota bacterium]